MPPPVICLRTAPHRRIDNCGLHNDLDYYAALMNATGKAFLVEHVAGAPPGCNMSRHNMLLPPEQTQIQPFA